jgi:hypothetical protein
MAKRDEPNIFETVKSQLESEIKGDAEAVIKTLRPEFDGGTVELSGPEATQYAQQGWVQGKGLRTEEEIDRIGPEKWWEQYFQHVGTDVTPLGKEIFLNAITQGIGFVDALHFATVLGGMVPEKPVMPASASIPVPGPMMPPPQAMGGPPPMDIPFAPPPGPPAGPPEGPVAPPPMGMA